MDDATAAGLLREMRCVHLASTGGDGRPHASVAPFVCHAGALYVFLSALAPHAGNLRERPAAGVLVVRDEAACAQPFARPRLALACAAAARARGDADTEHVLDLFEARFGATVATLRALPDFTLFRLAPRDGQLVTGFGRACALDAAALRAAIAAAAGP